MSTSPSQHKFQQQLQAQQQQQLQPTQQQRQDHETRQQRQSSMSISTPRSASATANIILASTTTTAASTADSSIITTATAVTTTTTTSAAAATTTTTTSSSSPLAIPTPARSTSVTATVPLSQSLPSTNNLLARQAPIASTNHGGSRDEPTQQQLHNVATALGYLNMLAAQENTIDELRQLLERREQQIRTLQSQLDLYKRMFSFQSTLNHGSTPPPPPSLGTGSQVLNTTGSSTSSNSQAANSSQAQASLSSSSSSSLSAVAAANAIPIVSGHHRASGGNQSQLSLSLSQSPILSGASLMSSTPSGSSLSHHHSQHHPHSQQQSPSLHHVNQHSHIVSTSTPLSSFSSSQHSPSPGAQHQHDLTGGSRSSSSLLRHTPLSPVSGSSAVASPLLISHNQLSGQRHHSFSHYQHHHHAGGATSLSSALAGAVTHSGTPNSSTSSPISMCGPGAGGTSGTSQLSTTAPPPGVAPPPGSGTSTTTRLNSMQIKCKFGYLGSGRSQFNSPHGFCLGFNQEIIVADTNNHRICVFDKNGNFMSQFGVSGKEEGQLWNPRKVAILPRSQLSKQSISLAHANSSVSGSSSSSGNGSGLSSGNIATSAALAAITNINTTTTNNNINQTSISCNTALASADNRQSLFVVCDRGAERSRMQLFTKDGVFIKKIGIQYIDIVAGLAITQDGLIIVVDSVSPTVYIISGDTGVLKGWFDCSNHMKEPSDIAVKSDSQRGNEYFICDFKGHCVVVFSESGEYLRKIGYDGLTSYPNGIDISDDGDILVGDSHGNRFHVVVFDKRGNFMSQFECPHVKVSRCCGLKITREGYIVTLAKNNHHVLILNTLFISST